MSPKIVKAIVAILEDSANQDEHVANIAEAILDKVEELQKESHKVAVVGQLLLRGREAPQVVVLGPFSARGSLSTEEAWKAAAAAHTASRAAGGGLAWRRNGSDHGRYMLAPVFGSAEKAWKFFPEHPEEDMAPIEEEFRSIRGIDSANIAGPACLCGFKSAVCYRHPHGRGVE